MSYKGANAILHLVWELSLDIEVVSEWICHGLFFDAVTVVRIQDPRPAALQLCKPLASTWQTCPKSATSKLPEHTKIVRRVWKQYRRILATCGYISRDIKSSGDDACYVRCADSVFASWRHEYEDGSCKCSHKMTRARNIKWQALCQSYSAVGGSHMLPLHLQRWCYQAGALLWWQVLPQTREKSLFQVTLNRWWSWCT